MVEISEIGKSMSLPRNILHASFASFYAREFRWYLFPIKPLAKSPGLVKWSLQASNDPKQVAEWWTRWPQANVGLDCGKSHIFVLDVDQHSPEANGQRALDELEIFEGKILTTTWLRSRTPNNGTHHFYRDDLGLKSTKGVLGVGLDTRARGGMVLLPPSRLPTGSYQWIVGGAP